ncbi:MAG TPA: hypothetical protein VM076_25910 [Gemmatimonadaceae bacterium]|nr:hypothetical protein [Gemmatimonadaceae bacterium]
MADAVFGAAGEIWAIVWSALTDPGPFLVAGLVVLAAGSAIFFKGKLSAMIWLPALAAAAVLSWRQFVR